MKKKYAFILILLVGILSTCWGQKKWSADQIRTDLLFLKQISDSLHPGIIASLDTAVINTHFRETYNSVTDSLTLKQFYGKLNPFVQQYKDLHTYVSFRKMFGNLNTVLPARLYGYNQNLYVIKPYGKDNPLLPGDQITGINNKLVKDIYTELINYSIRPDGDLYPYHVFEVRHAFPVIYAAFIEQPEHYQLSIIRNNQPLEITVNAYSNKESDFKEVGDFNTLVKTVYKEEEISYSKIDSINTYLLKISSFDHMIKQNKTYNKLFKEIKKSGAQNLIIDIRDNPGGNYLLSGWLLQHVYKDKFYLIDTTYLLRKKRLPLPKKLVSRYSRYSIGVKRIAGTKYYRIKDVKFVPDKKPYTGNIYVLINNQSMSTSSILAGNLKSTGRATLIGEETGNLYGGFCAGGFINFKLPNTGMYVQLPLNYLKLKVNTDKNKPDWGVMPDLLITPTEKEIMTNKDPLLLKAIQLIKQNP